MLVMRGSWSVPGAAFGLGSVPGPGFIVRDRGAAPALPGASPMAAAPANAPPRRARRDTRLGSVTPSDTIGLDAVRQLISETQQKDASARCGSTASVDAAT